MSAIKTDDSMPTIEIKLNLPTGESTKQVVETSKSGRDLKDMFLRGNKKPIYLRVKGKRINDGDVLGDKINHGDTVVAHEAIMICVECTDGNDLCMMIDPYESVPNLKALIEKHKKIAPAEQLLLYAGSPLEDIATLYDYQIGDGTVLSVSRIYPLLTMFIQIKMMGAESKSIDFRLEVVPNNTIVSVKELIAKKFTKKLADNQKIDLIFEGRSLLEENRAHQPFTLEDHGVADSSELFAFIRYNEG